MNSYYEKIGNETHCIDEEIPFDVPESWEWVRLGNLIELYSGRDLSPQEYNAKNQGIPYITGASNIIENQFVVNRWTECPAVLSTKGDLLITCKGTVGTMTLNILGNVHIARQIMAIRTSMIDIDYIRIFLLWYMPNLIQQAKSMIPGISRENILDAIIPLPSINEQYRISNQLKIIESLLSKYDKFEQQEFQLESEFPDKLKKSILQSAIQGKLVIQNPNDEPASILLEKVRKEKELLIKAGKIKKDKNESVIFKNIDDNSYYEKIGNEVRCIDEEIPFDVPESWEWCRFEKIITYTKNIDIQKHLPLDTIINYVDIDAIDNHNKIIREVKKKTVRELSTRARRVLKSGYIAYSTVRPYLDNIVIIQDDLENYIGSTGFIVFRPIEVELKYLFFFLFTPYINFYYKGMMIGFNSPSISNEQFEKTLVPLPPLSEQKSIVNKIEILFSVLS